MYSRHAGGPHNNSERFSKLKTLQHPIIIIRTRYLHDPKVWLAILPLYYRLVIPTDATNFGHNRDVRGGARLANRSIAAHSVCLSDLQIITILFGCLGHERVARWTTDE